MATRKARAKSKGKRRPLIPLDPERLEEIAAIGFLILAVLTALGALNLSGGMLLGSWVQVLQTLFGRGVFFAPLILLGLGLWLLLDALDRSVKVGWMRMLALGAGFLLLLTCFHWLDAPDLMRVPLAHAGGGLVGWAIGSALVQALGEIGGLLALGAMIAVVLILLFNVSLAELVIRVAAPLRLGGQGVRALWKRIPKRLPRRRSAPVRPELAVLTPEPSRAASSMDEEHEEPIKPQPTEGSISPPPPEPVASVEQLPLPTVGIDPESVPPAPVEYQLPEIRDMLEEGVEQEITPQEIRTRVRQIEETLSHFGVPAKVTEVNQGPTITQFGVEPGFVEQKGIDGKIHRVKVKVSRISALQHDLELALAAAPIRIEAPVPGRSVVGIEVPNSHVALVSLRSVLESSEFKGKTGKLRIALGQDVEGQPVCADLASMPHLLIAGATGSGKSVCINAIIATLLCTMTPDQVRFVMVDPKRVELVNFNKIPHLLRDVVVDVNGAVGALQDTVKEMDERFRLFGSIGARNVETYNHLLEATPEEQLPFHVIIVDELADLMMVAPDEVERTITRLAQMARATGIHLILATQRPSVDVVTGLIKANFPARISFAVTSQIDSRVVLDTPGAEKLLGRGDMLYMASDSSKLRRLQGCYVSDAELDRLVDYWKQYPPPPGTLGPAEASSPGTTSEDSGMGGSDEELVSRAIEVVKQSNRASVSLLQRKLRIGYSRASRLMDTLETKGIVGPDEGPSRGRPVLVAPEPPPEQPAPEAKGKETEEPDPFADWTEKDWADLDKG